MNVSKKICLSAFVILFSCCVRANTRLPLLFGDNMVLQRNQPISVWGWAEAGEKIAVQFDRQTKYTKADKKGHWILQLDPEAAGGPFQLIVKGKNLLTISNVLVGEVWICSGQSNMEFAVRGVRGAAKETELADFPQIRHFKVPNTVSAIPRDNLSGGEWQVCSPQTVGSFTAVGYFFARDLYRQLHVPVGLINTSWGGTQVEAWISRDAFEHADEFKQMVTTMPQVDLAAITRQKSEALLKKIESLQGPLPAASEEEQWKAASYDDSRWPRMKLPGLWEQQGLGLEDLDGVVWFRKTVILADEDAGKPALLDAGKIDDADETYINGVKVGSTKGYSAARHYTIPPGILKAGKNSIVIRVEDTGGGGGINGEPDSMQLTISNKVQSLAGDWSFRIASVSNKVGGIGPNSYPDLLYNAMINPLIPYTIKGAIWYQGEANAGRAYQYRKAFPLMITDWRSHWAEGDFPFYFVQLASWNANNGNSERGSSWAELREAQTMTLSLPNTGMAVTTDIGESNDIHPKNKQDVGARLAAIALNNLYGKTMEDSGPVYQSMQKDGNKITLTFAHTGSGLLVRDKYGYLKGFEIAGADQRFHYAKAYIDGNRVIVYQDGVTDPAAVRYGWADDAGEDNFFNKEGFPASPFRTDQWKGVTEGVKYTVRK